jgi:hypothetical protein
MVVSRFFKKHTKMNFSEKEFFRGGSDLTDFGPKWGWWAYERGKAKLLKHSKAAKQTPSGWCCSPWDLVFKAL